MEFKKLGYFLHKIQWIKSNRVKSKWNNKEGIVNRNKCVCINSDEVNAWPKTVCSQDKFRTMVIKYREYIGKNPVLSATSKDVNKFNLNKSGFTLCR
jgi:hypothetical protein